MDKGKEKIEEVEDHHHDAWVNSFIKRTQSIGSRPSQIDPCTIYRIARSIRQGDPDAYEPQIVSIGPYHRANQSLQAMEDHKWHHLYTLLSRDHYHSLVDYINEIQPLVDRARCCYSENIKFSNHEFVEMMVLDGCFIVELFLNVYRKQAVDEVGPIYSTKWMVPLLGQDMLLLENQLPFFILQRLFDLVNRSISSSLIDLALNFFDYFLPMNQTIQPSNVVHHLLHLFHSHIIPTPRVGPTSAFDHRPASLTRSIPSITEIRRAGIKFKKKKAGSFLDVTYRKGEIQIPSLSIYDSSTKTLFRNMIAFEQCHPKSGTYFTGYAIFMYCIIETTKDVTVLKQNGIIEHWLGDDEKVVHLFKRMCQGLTVDFNDNYLLGMINHVTAEFRENKWNAWWDTWKRVYFDQSLSILKIEATLFTLVFTGVQTFLAIRAQYPPRP